MKKTLIYHFYATDDYLDNVANKIHFALMDKYFNIFDKAIISIAVDDIENKELVKDVISELSKHIECSDIRFKVIQNNRLYESQTFKNEIVDNLEDLEYSVFFGHNKGTTNIKRYDNNKIFHWIHTMYFYNFNYIDEMEDYLYSRSCPTETRFISFYGSNLLTQNIVYKSAIEDNRSIYAGTFYWMNASSIKHTNKKLGRKLLDVDNRFYAEVFPSLFGWPVENLGSHGQVRLFSNFFDPYVGVWEEYVKWYGDSEKYYAEHNEILNKIKE